ncbi:MAG TPA: tetratricopeptide repeat protein [Myxococcales bacterium]|jgi:tetratricopeptide (TPR) repeat protein
MHSIAVAALVALGPLVAPVDGAIVTPPKHKYLTLPEILQRMEASPVHYVLHTLDKLEDVPQDSLKDQIWPQIVEPVDLPKVGRGASGRFDVSAWPAKPEALEANEAAEELFKNKDLEGAAKKYREAIAADPDFYIAYANLGDCLLFGARDPKAALVQYEKALKLNPDDYRLHFYRGNTLLALGRKGEAVEEFVTSLVLKPRNPILISKLRSEGSKLGIRVQGELLDPWGFARREGEAVAAYSDPKKPGWLGWASCKAFWIGEPSHRKEMTGSTDEGWSTTEDLECMVALISAHLVTVEKDLGKADPAVQQLESVLKDGLASAFVVYELGSRLDPQITLKIERSFHPTLRKYIRKYVLGLGGGGGQK